MIHKLTASTIYSTLGNNSSLVPLGIKDVANSCGLTAASYMSGDKFEGKDRFIDEFGTQAIWLGGLPTFKWLLGKGLCLPKKFDSKIDARILKDKDILQAAQDFAPTEAIKNSIKHVAEHAKAYKGITWAKFIGATILTAAAYFGLTKFRHKYTEEQIKKEYLKNNSPSMEKFTHTSQVSFSSFANGQKPQKNVSFTGGIESFMFDPVRNLMLVDGVITGERLSHARNPQDLMGYIIKEGSFWMFAYFAGPMIAKALENRAEKNHNKSIDLDARVIEFDKLKNAFQDGTLKQHIKAFKSADVSDVDIYKFAVNPQTDNLVIDMAKKSDVIKTLKNSNAADTRKYIDLKDLRSVNEKLEKLLNQWETSNQSAEEFFKQVRKLKRASVLKNIGSCIGVLGILAPATMLLIRKFGNNSEYQVKKDIEAKLAQENL